MSLEKLIQDSINQDRRAQKALYEAYKDALYTVVYRITGDINLSEDLLQESFIDAFRNIKSLKEPKYFYSWIRTILVRKTYAHLKMQTKTEELDLGTVGGVSIDESSDVGYIEKAIHCLPYKCRTVFVMVEIEGFSHKEIAHEMGISVGTSKSQLHFAKTKLKAMLSSILKD